MKKIRIASVFTCAFALCLALTACGGSASSSSAASSGASSSASSASASSASASADASSSASASSSAAASSQAADPGEKFVGEWVLAAVESGGMTMSGDFTMMFGSSDPTTLSIKADGTGSMTFVGEAADLTWAQKDDETIALTPSSEGGTGELEVVYDEDGLMMNMSDEDFSGTLIFTADGTSDIAKEITAANGKPITSESGLLGTWKLVGMNMAGISMYGNADDLAAMIGDSGDMSVTFEQGGVCDLMGEQAAWTVSSDGAAITGDNGLNVPILALGDDLMIDIAGMADELDLGDMEVVFVFSK